MAVSHPVWRTNKHLNWSIAMLDILMLALGVGFFALSVGYTVACDRL